MSINIKNQKLMKIFLVIILMSLSSITTAQSSIEKNLGDFTIVKVYDLINVIMIQSDENKMIISGKNKNDVRFINKNGKLKIKMNLEESYDGDNTEITLYYKAVDLIDANEGANVTIRGVIDQYEIELKTQEGAKITAELNTSYANFRAVTGGVINVIGSTKNQDISIYTGGVVNGEDFITEQTEVSINIAGEAYINATEKAKVKIKAGGDVYIYGNPKKIDKQRVFGGRIKRM